MLYPHNTKATKAIAKLLAKATPQARENALNRLFSKGKPPLNAHKKMVLINGKLATVWYVPLEKS